MREALRRLQQDGLVEARPGGCYVVATVTPKEIHEFYWVRSALAELVSMLAAERITEAEVAELEELMQRMEETQAAGDDVGLAEASDKFQRPSPMPRAAGACPGTWSCCTHS